MKLPGINYNWKAQPLAKRDIYAPQKVAGAEARAAGAWAGASNSWARAAGSEANASRAIGRVYEQVGGYVTDAMMKIQQESYETEAQGAYVNSINQMNELENKLYTSKALSMEDPLMSGVSYDDSYDVVDGDKIVTMNSGTAPLRDVGQQVWTVQSQAIVNNFSQGMSKGAQKIYGSKIRDQVISKTQNMGRHVLKMNFANQQETLNNSIDQSNRVGDTSSAIRIAEEGFKRGILDQKQMNGQIANSRQQGDLLRFNQELSVTNDDGNLARLSNVALFSDNYMTTAQKVQSSNAALAKIRMNRQEAKQNLADWRDSNTMDAIISHYKGEMSVADLNSNPEAYGRANYVPLFDRMTRPSGPVVSDPGIIRSYGEEIINAPFDVMDTESSYRDLRADIASSVKRGDLSPDDYMKLNDMIDKQSKAPFNRQPYSEAKKALFVDMLGTLDAATMEEINNAGVNLSGMMLKKMGQSANVSKLTMRAFEDMNQYVRQNGQQADPVKWWKENKKSYESTESGSSDVFQTRYPNDTITLQNGKLDTTSTENNIVRAYNNGDYGVPGSNKAMMEFSKRASVLKGFDPKDFE